MRNVLLASTAVLALFAADINSPGHAFLGSGIVLDPSNLAQNIEQVLQGIQQGLRTLELIDQANRAVTGTSFSLTGELRRDLVGVQTVLRQGNIVFDQFEVLEDMVKVDAGAFETLKNVQQVSAILQRQNAQILGASGQLFQSQAVSAATITDVMANIESILGKSESAQGQTQALQLGNQLDAQTTGLLAQMHANQLASQQLQAQLAAQQAADIEARRDLAIRMRDKESFAGRQYPGVVPSGFE